MSSELNLRLDAGPRAPSTAREALTRLETDLCRPQLDSVRLLVSELVTNSVRHAGDGRTAPVGLEVRVSDDRVRVEVSDRGSGFDPAPRDDDQDQASGWGLYLVNRLADRWGVIRNDVTRVWFELDRRHRSLRPIART